jgi:hypothetical protein
MHDLAMFDLTRRVESIRDATPAEHAAATRVCRAASAHDIAVMLGLHVPAHLEDEDDGT